MVIALSVINIFGVKTGALIQNIFTAAKVTALLGLVLLGFSLGRNAQALPRILTETSGTTPGWARSMPYR